ncbi:GNAT family N-acetyltransferase [Candidatus Bipolaricaulota bacterium]|nr:GNAT family N-acetyltransferase [Candidatus Bipolaricaulota bacterium]
MLVGRKVILRTFRQPDTEGLYDLIADVREIGDFWPLDVGSEGEWLKRFQENGWWTDDFGRMLVTDHEGRRLGYTNYYKASHSYRGLEIGYRIFRPEDRGKGFMRDAVALFTAFLFASKPIERVQALVDPGNDASRTVLERGGFTREGVLRHALFDRGVFHDLVIFSILRADAPSLADLLAPLQAK